LADIAQDHIPNHPVELAQSSTPAPFDPFALLQNYGSSRISSLRVAPPLDISVSASGQICEASPAYEKYLDLAAHKIFEPKALGNLNLLRHQYDCDIHTTNDVFNYVNKALSVSDDKYTRALSPAEVAQYRRASDGGYAGIGVSILPALRLGIQNSAGDMVIQQTAAGKSAQKAGLLAGDSLISIDGQDVRSASMPQIAALIDHGAPGTKVDIVVDRNGQKVEKLVPREAIESPPVVHAVDEGDGVVYIKIDTFLDKNESSQLQSAMEKNANARAFIVDLRNNGGGQVDQALHSAELFINHGRLMSSRQRLDSAPEKPVYSDNDYVLGAGGLTESSVRSDNGKVTSLLQNRLPDLAGERPVVLLTNGDTASASEIFAGALHDTGHATILGAPTRGKGIAQEAYFNMPDGGYLEVTSTRYKIPSGRWLGDDNKQKYPLQPDLPVGMAAGTAFGSASDNQLSSAMTYIKTKLQGR